MASEMVERAAQAIYNATLGDPGSYPDAEHIQWSITAAEAAIAAMREPTEAMKNAVRNFGEDDANLWRIMIDAALSD